MRLLTVNLCLTLLCGTSALFAVNTTSTSAPRNPTAEPNDATAQLNTSRVPHDESQTQAATGGPTRHTAAAAGSNATESREANVSSAGYGSDVSAAASSRHRVSTSAAEATPSHGGTTAGAAEPETTASTGTTTAAAALAARSSAASSAPAESTLEARSTTGPGVTQDLSSANSSDYSTHPSPSTRSFSSPPASTGSTNTTNRTVEAPPALDPTSPPVRKPDPATATAGPSAPQPVSDAHTPTSKPPDTTGPSSGSPSPPVRKPDPATATAGPSTPQPVSDAHTPTSKPPDTTGPSSGSPSPPDSTAFSSSPTGIFIRPVSKFAPVSTTKPAPATTAAPRASQSPSTTAAQPCSSRGLVTQCLIIIAALAGLATVFMVSTIVLCAKISARKYKAKTSNEETEMMCISALLPERNHSYTRQRNPVSNGVLVLPMGADSDEDMGDNLTLSSFLPENERIV